MSQRTLGDYEPDPDAMTEAERAIYEDVVEGDMGVREYAREQEWSSPGTASNLLRRARATMPALEGHDS